MGDGQRIDISAATVEAMAPSEAMKDHYLAVLRQVRHEGGYESAGVCERMLIDALAVAHLLHLDAVMRFTQAQGRGTGLQKLRQLDAVVTNAQRRVCAAAKDLRRLNAMRKTPQAPRRGAGSEGSGAPDPGRLGAASGDGAAIDAARPAGDTGVHEPADRRAAGAIPRDRRTRRGRQEHAAGEARRGPAP